MIKINFKKQLHTSDGFLNLEINIQAKNKSFITLTGKSGSGKTTFLRILAGLTKPDSGKIVINGKILFSDKDKINISPQKRNIGFVFQDYALFPNFTIYKNLLYVSKDKEKIDEILNIMDIKSLANRYPDKLSGGQKQRVALARAIIKKPKILLLDEPLSALDVHMRCFLQNEIVKIFKLYPITVFLVSHDIPEIFKLSDRVIMIDKGKIIQDGEPDKIFNNTITSNKFSFIGEIVKIIKADIIYIAYVAFDNNISEIIISEDDYKNLRCGDKVLAASKAFNPIIKKIEY